MSVKSGHESRKSHPGSGSRVMGAKVWKHQNLVAKV